MKESIQTEQAQAPIEELMDEAKESDMIIELWAKADDSYAQTRLQTMLKNLSADTYLYDKAQLDRLRLKAAKLGWGLGKDDELPRRNLLYDDIADSLGPLMAYDFTSGMFTLKE
jgi:hypothetical protein